METSTRHDPVTPCCPLNCSSTDPAWELYTHSHRLPPDHLSQSGHVCSTTPPLHPLAREAPDVPRTKTLLLYFEEGSSLLKTRPRFSFHFTRRLRLSRSFHTLWTAFRLIFSQIDKRPAIISIPPPSYPLAPICL
ncbi:hypothetical protein CLAIMM_07813, partial [Cladophialophora immunda]